MHLFVPLLVVSGLAAASPVTLAAGSQIDSVTVYVGSAQVTRVSRLQLSPGDVQVQFDDLPEQLVDDSLGVQGRGTARATVFGASVERMPQIQAVSPDAQRAQDHVSKLEHSQRALDDRREAGRARLAFAESVKATFSQERAQNLPVRHADPKEWAAMADFVAQQVEQARGQLRLVELESQRLATELQAAREELAKLQAKQTRMAKRISVDLRVAEAGTFELKVTYLVPGASWRPIWDARLDPAKEQVKLVLSGVVSQRSGEDWKDASLVLSTAQPSRVLEVPELPPAFLQAFAPPPPPPSPMGGMAPEAPSAPRAATRGEVMSDDEEVALTDEVTYAPAAVTQGLFSAMYEAPRRESVDGAGRPLKVMLATYALKSKVERITAPPQNAQAWLTAKAVNDQGVPMLPGEVSVFVGEEFLGRTQLPSIAAGEEVKLAFGADDRIKVERRQVERRHETAGLFGGDDRIRYHYRTKVKNLYQNRVEVVVEERIPVSQDESIEVKILDTTTSPTLPEDPDRPGVRRYRLALEPQQEKVVDLQYEVRFPRGKPIAGLE